MESKEQNIDNYIKELKKSLNRSLRFSNMMHIKHILERLDDVRNKIYIKIEKK